MWDAKVFEIHTRHFGASRERKTHFETSEKTALEHRIQIRSVQGRHFLNEEERKKKRKRRSREGISNEGECIIRRRYLNGQPTISTAPL